MNSFVKVILLTVSVFILASCSSFHKEETEQDSDVLKNDTITILTLGIDTRGEEKSRSDAILITQYDKKAKSVKIASIMRDSYVKIPTYSKGYNKLNLAYYLGGKDLLVKTIQENFNITIDHVIEIDFEGFTYVVDAIAPKGIEVDVPQNMIADMDMNIQPGNNSLHGEDLLKYVRFRHDENYDFGRVKRQQEVLLKLKDELTNELSFKQLISLPKVIEGAMQYVTSDLSIPQTLSLASLVLLNPIDEVQTMTIPLENSYESRRYEHAGEVLQLDFSKNIEALSGFFNLPEAVSN
ncbi:LCP family protein [Bacillus sp. AGMB 02131]|uniref:LCP family protein n=1 Tax=Peribacillus faecalis TaxID=2772559 RepID=A0A927HDS7_9BACI|nr:LCP family protein [Peribacillus faecalis]MBD3109778.1 LCP family protein [Peribacillus faecalis]